MGATNTEHYSDQQIQISRLAKALGHPGRLAIIEHLLKMNACICNDISEVVPLAQATISQHLKELKTAGLIQGTVSGNTICYCLKPETFELLEKYFNKTMSEIRTNSCC